MKKEILEVESGQRLDKAVSLARPEYSRASIEKLINTGAITVNGQAVKTKYAVREGDTIEAVFTQLEREPEEIDLPVVYEDENVVVINKPIGILAHSKGTFNKEGTVASWLKTHVTAGVGDLFWQSNRAGIVHRLDRATSGIMICAKNEATQSHLGKQFSNRNVKKTYQAIVSGTLPQPAGLIDVPIERNPKKPATFRAGANGKSAQTHFTTIKTVAQAQKPLSLVELKPITGRTHQLRVHLHYLKCPIVGDDFYGGLPAERLMLHAQSLEITLPGGVRKTFSAPLPDAFEELLQS